VVQADARLFRPASALAGPAGSHGRAIRDLCLLKSGSAGLRKPFDTAGVLRAPPATAEAATVNETLLLNVIVDMSAVTNGPNGQLPDDADAAIRQLYSHHAKALHGYVEHFCPDGASSDDIVQETFIRAWRHLPQLSADDRPIRPWLFRVARNLLIDADRAARARPVTVQEQPDEEAGTDPGLDQVLDRELVSGALQHLSPVHQAVLVQTFYQGGTLATVARELGIPHGTARSRLHYALHALRQQLQDHDAIAC
jgi:RNA polymerase sigma-70 factor, ECF subfamily